jgi:hypothetical protein
LRDGDDRLVAHTVESAPLVLGRHIAGRSRDLNRELVSNCGAVNNDAPAPRKTHHGTHHAANGLRTNGIPAVRERPAMIDPDTPDESKEMEDAQEEAAEEREDEGGYQ